MAFDKNAPDYNNWNKASQARKLAQSQWLKYRNTDSVKAEKYKKLYWIAKDKQNMYASKVRSYKPTTSNNITSNTNSSTITSNSNNNLDTKEHSQAIINWQNASWTNTKINKVETVNKNEWTVNIPDWNWSTNSWLSNSNTVSWQNVPWNTTWNTTYNSIYWWDKLTTSNNVNKTDYTKVEDKTNNFDSSNASSSYKNISSRINAWLNYKWDFNKLKDRTIKKYWSIDSYVKKYKDNLNSQVSSWKLTKSEANDLNKKFDWFMSDKMWYSPNWWIDQNNLNTSDAWTWTINWWYRTETYTDSEWNVHHRNVKNNNITINYNEITDRLSKSLFWNNTFKSNINVYVDSLQKQIEDQRKVLESQQSDLKNMYKNQEADFQGQFWDIYAGIEKREADIKARFWNIEAWIKQKFDDVQKTMGEQKAWEKAWLEANLRAKGLSEWAISNALTKIDKKYDQSSRKDYAAYTDNMRSLAGDYDKLAASITSSKSWLTQNKLSFSNALINRSKALTDAAAKFDKEAVKTLNQPIVDIYKSRSDQSKNLELNTRTKAEKQARYKAATPEERLTILNDYKISLKWLWVKVDQLSVEDFNKASEFNSQAKALIYLTEKANWTESISGSTWNAKLDNFIKTAKENLPENSTSDNNTDNTSDNNTDNTSDNNTDNTSDNNTDNTSDNSSNDYNNDNYKYWVDTNWDWINDASRDDSWIYKLNKNDNWFNIDEMKSWYVNWLNDRIEKAINWYYNKRWLNWMSPIIWFSNPFSNDSSTSDSQNDRYQKDLHDYTKWLEKTYPWISDYAKEKMWEAIKWVESAKDKLITDIATWTTLNKEQAKEFVDYRIGNSPKDILLNANKPSSYINIIKDKESRWITPADIIK